MITEDQDHRAAPAVFARLSSQALQLALTSRNYPQEDKVAPCPTAHQSNLERLRHPKQQECQTLLIEQEDPMLPKELISQAAPAVLRVQKDILTTLTDQADHRNVTNFNLAATASRQSELILKVIRRLITAELMLTINRLDHPTIPTEIIAILTIIHFRFWRINFMLKTKLTSCFRQ